MSIQDLELGDDAAFAVADATHDLPDKGGVQGRALRYLVMRVRALEHDVRCADYATRQLAKDSLRLEELLDAERGGS